MGNPNGTPIWYELMTDAPDAAEAYYGSVMGWTFESQPGGADRDYRIFSAQDGENVGGVMKAPGGGGSGARWAVYFGVDDLDRAVEKLTALGGSVHMEATDIPDVGRFAFVADPQGASFYLMQAESDGESTSFAPAQRGHCSWNELVTSDRAAALDFYGALLGWTKAGAMPMGEGEEYTFIQAAGSTIGAMMNAPAPGTAPYWNFAFTVGDIDATKAAVEQGGGTVRAEPMELPMEGDWMIQTTDPQGAGAMFTGPRKG